jgi:hypothetical protein
VLVPRYAELTVRVEHPRPAAQAAGAAGAAA